jgi:hypothetical protein
MRRNGWVKLKCRIKIEKLIGRLLKATEEVHHHTDGTLVACESKTYHHLLHQRTRALEACGHANWRKCQYCRKWDDPKNMTVTNHHAYHNRGGNGCCLTKKKKRNF